MRPIRLTAIVLATLLSASPVLAQTAAPAAATPLPRTTTPAPIAAPTATPAKVPDSALVDINSATPQQLDALPMIGEARAKAIVAGRPYRVKTDLVTRKVIPQNAYDAIQSRIVARQG